AAHRPARRGAGPDHGRGVVGLCCGRRATHGISPISERNSAAGAAGGADGRRCVPAWPNRHRRTTAGAAGIARYAIALAPNRIGPSGRARLPRACDRGTPPMIAFRSIGSALVVGTLAVGGCAKPATEEVETKTVIPVTTAPAEVGTIRAVIHATGDVNPALGAELIVVAPEAARIAEITKAEGDRVRRGEVLVRFEIPTLNAESLSKSAEATAAAARVE